jgi:hypothetical protein
MREERLCSIEAGMGAKGGPWGDQNIESTIKGHGRRNWVSRLLTWSMIAGKRPGCVSTRELLGRTREGAGARGRTAFARQLRVSGLWNGSTGTKIVD